MKKMKFLISQLYLLALFALPFVSTSCSDDDDNSTKVEISSLGVEDGTTIVTGQIIQLEAQLSNPQGEVHYSHGQQLERKSLPKALILFKVMSQELTR